MSDTTDPDAPPAPSRVRIIQAAPRPCAQCPWRTRDQTRVDRHGFYSLANLQRLWEGLRDGERMACHPTDPAMAEFAGYEQTASRRQTHECAGALVLIHRELYRFHAATKQTAPGSALPLYRDLVGELALTNEGIASHAFALLAGRTPLCGGVEVRRVDLADTDIAMPGLPGWGESPLDSAAADAMSAKVNNWIDEPGLLAMLKWHELDSWQVTESRVVVALYRARDRTVTNRSLRDIPVPARPDVAEILRQGLGDTAVRELLAGKQPRCAVEHTSSSGPMRPAVHCSPGGVCVELHSEEEWQQEVTWHTWREAKERLALPDPRQGAPEAPSGASGFRVLSWAQARAALQDAGAEQPTLLTPHPTEPKGP